MAHTYHDLMSRGLMWFEMANRRHPGLVGRGKKNDENAQPAEGPPAYDGSPMNFPQAPPPANPTLNVRLETPDMYIMVRVKAYVDGRPVTVRDIYNHSDFVREHLWESYGDIPELDNMADASIWKPENGATMQVVTSFEEEAGETSSVVGWDDDFFDLYRDSFATTALSPDLLFVGRLRIKPQGG